jgi:hypothetical protein
MKSGTGDDPFADPFEEEAADESESDTQRATSEAATEATESAESASETNSETEATAEPTPESEQASPDSSDTTDDGPDDSHIPWVLRRSSVKDDRPNITQFFLRDETDRAERRLRSDVEEILDKDVYTLDLREAAYLVAMEHPDEVAETLRDWGYEYLD